MAVSLLLWAACVAALIFLNIKEVDFTWRAPLALGMGILLATLLGENVAILLPLGGLYVRVLLLLTVPLVAINAILALRQLGNLLRTERGAGGTLVLLLLQTLLAAALATVGAGLTGVGLRFTAAGTAWGQGLDTGRYGWIIALLLLLLLLVRTWQRSPVAAASGKWLESVNRVAKSAFSTMVHLLPYAILTLSMQLSLDPIRCGVLPLLWLLLLTVLLCALHLFVVNGCLLLLRGCNPILFFRRMYPAMQTAFLTQSGSETMPLAQELMTTGLNVSPALSDLTGRLGTRLGMPGCAAIWPVTLTLFAAHATGTVWTPLQYGGILLATVVISVVTTGIPGTSMITPLVLFLVMGLPPALMVVLLSTSGLADMARTPTNVLSAAVVGVVQKTETSATQE